MSTPIYEGFLLQKKDRAIDYIHQELDHGTDPMAILNECQAAMEEVGKRFESGQFFLSELIYSAELFKILSPLIEKRIVDNNSEIVSIGTIVIGTPEGDIHDLGKNLVVTFLRANGFNVIDLGVDVPVQKFIDKIGETRAPILAMSALITPALFTMKEVIKQMKEQGLREETFVLIGGGVTTELVVSETGADYRGVDPMDAARVCKEHLTK